VTARAGQVGEGKGEVVRSDRLAPKQRTLQHMKYPIFFLSFLISFSIQGQISLDVKDKTFIYEAFFVNSSGDTLTHEIIEMSFKDTAWKYQPKTQNEVVITYNTDEEGIKSFVYPFEKVRKKHQKNQRKKESGKKGWEKWTWMDEQEVTGYTLNDTVFWIHPPRDNQYMYMELSGMPQINSGRLKTGERWTGSTLYMMTGWHDWKGKLVSDYHVTGSESYNYKKVNATNAWSISCVHNHSKLGKYSSEMIIDEKEYGFLRLDNNYPDGNRIIMSLIEVKNSGLNND